MGLTVPAGAAARSAVEGYDAKLHDPYFDGVSQQLADKGFVTAAADDLITTLSAMASPRGPARASRT